jgi:hypothetical protein
MQSAYHSLLPTIDGVQQAPGQQFAAQSVAYEADDRRASLSLDLAAAYPPAAGIDHWQRTITLQRGEGVAVVDQFALNKPAQVIALTLLTPSQVDHQSEPGRLHLTPATFVSERESGAAVVEYDSTLFRVTTQQLPITDARMGPVWGKTLTQIILRAENPPTEAEWHFRIRR